MIESKPLLPAQCMLCGLGFLSSQELKMHQEAAHVQVFQCLSCSKKFSRQSSLYAHQCIHVGIKQELESDYIPDGCLDMVVEDCKDPTLNESTIPEYTDQEVDSKMKTEFSVPVLLVKPFFVSTNVEQPFLHGECSWKCERGVNVNDLAFSPPQIKTEDESMCMSVSHNAELSPSSVQSCLNGEQGDKFGGKPEKEKTENGKYSYMCIICRQRFTMAKTLLRHITKKHGKTFDCDECGRHFKRHRDMVRHKVIHGVPEFKCEHCGKSFKYKKSFLRHVEQHSSKSLVEGATVDQENTDTGTENTCNVCKETFMFKRTLLRHMKTHKKIATNSEFVADVDRGFAEKQRCTECLKEFSCYVSFKKHVCGGKRFRQQCKLCHRQFFSLRKWKSHTFAKCLRRRGQNDELTNKGMHNIPMFKCENCDRSFKYEKSFLSHLEQHSIKGCDGETNTDQENIEVRTANTCDVCRKTFTYRRSLLRHMAVHRKFLVHSNVVVDTGSGMGKKHRCTVCLKEFSYYKSFLNHDCQSQSFQYECRFCHKEFPFLKSFRSHMARYYDETTMDNVDGSVGEENDANDEDRDVTQFSSSKDSSPSSSPANVAQPRPAVVKPHVCDACGKGFMFSRALQKHMQEAHAFATCQSDIQPGVGGLSLNDTNIMEKKNTLKHKTIPNGVKSHKCAKCKKRFSYATQLKSHILQGFFWDRRGLRVVQVGCKTDFP